MMLLGMKKKLEDELAEEMKKLEDDNIPEDTKTEKTTVIFLWFPRVVYPNVHGQGFHGDS